MTVPVKKPLACKQDLVCFIPPSKQSSHGGKLTTCPSSLVFLSFYGAVYCVQSEIIDRFANSIVQVESREGFHAPICVLPVYLNWTCRRVRENLRLDFEQTKGKSETTKSPENSYRFQVGRKIPPPANKPFDIDLNVQTILRPL